MPNYHIRSLDSGGLAIASHDPDCHSDLHARAVAMSLLTMGGVAEVWSGSRCVEVVVIPRPNHPNMQAEQNSLATG